MIREHSAGSRTRFLKIENKKNFQFQKNIWVYILRKSVQAKKMWQYKLVYSTYIHKDMVQA